MVVRADLLAYFAVLPGLTGGDRQLQRPDLRPGHLSLHPREPRSVDLLLLGPPGAGKSQLAQALGCQAVKGGLLVLYLFDVLRDFQHDQRWLLGPGELDAVPPRRRFRFPGRNPWITAGFPPASCWSSRLVLLGTTCRAKLYFSVNAK